MRVLHFIADWFHERHGCVGSRNMVKDMTRSTSDVGDHGQKFCETRGGWVTQEYCTYVCPEMRRRRCTTSWNQLYDAYEQG
jgi:hypothetical protein